MKAIIIINMTMESSSPKTWYFKKQQNDMIYVWTGERLLNIKQTDKEIQPGPVKEVKIPQSLLRAEVKKYYCGGRRQKEGDILIFFEKRGSVIILDHNLYDQTNRENKLDGGSVERRIETFKENNKEPTRSAEKRKRAQSPPRPTNGKQKWDTKSTTYQQTMSAAVAGKRVLHGKKDVFKVPLENIVESVTYSTREKSEVFVETIKKSMHSEIKMDSIAYLVSEGNPLDENGKLLDKNLYVLGGTHYLAALKKINEEKQMVEINAVIFKDLSDEETLWLGTQHNLSQHMCRRISAKEYNINSYSPWLGMCRCPLSTWKLLEKVFEMYEKGEVTGMKKVGTTLESHRLWRELLKLDVQAKDKILKDIVDKRFSIGDAIQDAQNRQCLDRVRDTIAEQLDMEWLEIEEKYGSRVSSEVLLPYASYGKDEIRLIIQKNRNRNQRQLFIVFTAFSIIPDVLNLADELKLEPEVVVVRESECRKQKLTDTTFPESVRPVVILKKVSSSVLQMYNMPINGHISNCFESLHDLLQVCIFPSDTVVDTTLDVDIAQELVCKELQVTASDGDLTVYKTQLSSCTQCEQIGIGESQID
ncbi:hypothetical protein OS493_038245 [Desmophyllum pertusum]|uniref:Uncharacterized protein n=1 Tax=Desmophyllum pertusum TaxID=174260 RepID=A0A9X0CQ87_9CNID|nr:hypothetical protein OS493_038245 [Desmophyllum pertusum]